jgi:hypothetical protein
MRILTLCLSACIFLVITGCRKYTDGPTISLMTKKSRLCNDWTLNFAQKNGNDITNKTETVKLIIEKDGTYSMSRVMNALGQFQGSYTNGIWIFDEAKTKFILFENGSVDPTSTFTIRELRSKSLTIEERFPSINVTYTYNYIIK